MTFYLLTLKYRSLHLELGPGVQPAQAPAGYRCQICRQTLRQVVRK